MILRLLLAFWRGFNIFLCGHPVDAREPLHTIRVYGARVVEYRCRYCTGTVAEYYNVPEGRAE